MRVTNDKNYAEISEARKLIRTFDTKFKGSSKDKRLIEEEFEKVRQKAALLRKN